MEVKLCLLQNYNFLFNSIKFSLAIEKPLIIDKIFALKSLNKFKLVLKFRYLLGMCVYLYSEFLNFTDLLLMDYKIIVDFLYLCFKILMIVFSNILNCLFHFLILNIILLK
jgi:hypothetical protein